MMHPMNCSFRVVLVLLSRCRSRWTFLILCRSSDMRFFLLYDSDGIAVLLLAPGKWYSGKWNFPGRQGIMPSTKLTPTGLC